MSGRSIEEIGLFPVRDLNNDGIRDSVYHERGGSTSGTIHLDYYIQRPCLGKGKNLYIPFDEQDPCKLDGFTWLYTRPRPFFYDESGVKFFSAGQRVLFKGKVDRIRGFRVTVKQGQPSEVRIVLSKCRVADYKDLSWATPTGERMDPQVIVGLAKCLEKRTDGCSKLEISSTPAEEAASALYVTAKMRLSPPDGRPKKRASRQQVERVFNEFFSSSEAQSVKVLAPVVRDFDIKAALIEGMSRYLGVNR